MEQQKKENAYCIYYYSGSPAHRRHTDRCIPGKHLCCHAVFCGGRSNRDRHIPLCHIRVHDLLFQRLYAASFRYTERTDRHHAVLHAGRPDSAGNHFPARLSADLQRSGETLSCLKAQVLPHPSYRKYDVQRRAQHYPCSHISAAALCLGVGAELHPRRLPDHRGDRSFDRGCRYA